ncbi:MAG: hypothetical protein WD361_05465 [Gracilimonas sp.]
MKAIIDRKVYNTETAEYISGWSNDMSTSDFGYTEEQLFRTPKGKFFTVGKGGPASGYAKPVAGGMSGSSNNFRVLSEKEAYEWLESRQETGLIEKLFPDYIEEA